MSTHVTTHVGRQDHPRETPSFWTLIFSSPFQVKKSTHFWNNSPRHFKCSSFLFSPFQVLFHPGKITFLKFWEISLPGSNFESYFFRKKKIFSNIHQTSHLPKKTSHLPGRAIERDFFKMPLPISPSQKKPKSTLKWENPQIFSREGGFSGVKLRIESRQAS